MLDGAFDEDGWVIGPVSPWPRAEAISIFSAEASSTFDASALGARARDHGLTIDVEPRKRYRAGAVPVADMAWIAVAPAGASSGSRVLVSTFPAERAPSLREEALAVATTAGGAGMDALVRRARRIWQVRVGEDALAALRVAAVLSAARLGAIFPADGGPLFGPKTAWSRADGRG